MSFLKDYIGNWDAFLTPIFNDQKVIEDLNILNTLYKNVNDGGPIIYPPQINVFEAFKACPYEKLAVVILVQDPYHDGSATGLATANSLEQKTLSSSLRIIKDTVSRTIYKGDKFDFDPTLLKWAKQGVLMLNTALTVESGHPLSHTNLWRQFTLLLLSRLSEYQSGLIYCLWGKNASLYLPLINQDSNLILQATHPVYASYRGMTWDCDHFIKINNHLKKINNYTITW